MAKKKDSPQKAAFCEMMGCLGIYGSCDPSYDVIELLQQLEICEYSRVCLLYTSCGSQAD